MLQAANMLQSKKMIRVGIFLAKAANQKLKLLYLAKIFLERTDEEHPLTTAQLIEALADYGVSAERKSLYSDMEALSLFGLDIVTHHAKQYGYFVANRTFELPQLKLLVDAVASSKVITEEKSRELMKKLESLTSVYNARQLHRQVIVANRSKTDNQQVYYNVDAIHEAISSERQITFRYFDYGLQKQKVYRDDGALRTASPYALLWDDENYYLVAYYEKYEKPVHFRVDKMESITVTDAPRLPMPKGFSLEDYSRRVFNMYGGEEQAVRLRFDNSLIGVVLDRFGKDLLTEQMDEHSFSVRVQVSVSPTFFGWLFQFGPRAEILSPDSVREQFARQLDAVLAQYGKMAERQ